jgi:hypothetical protein
LRDSDKTPHFRDRQYGIRKEGDTLMIGNSEVDLDEPGVIAVRLKRFKLTKGFWDLLTRKDVNTFTISPKDIGRYKSILEMTSAHLTGYEPLDNIQTSRGLKSI